MLETFGNEPIKKGRGPAKTFRKQRELTATVGASFGVQSRSGLRLKERKIEFSIAKGTASSFYRSSLLLVIQSSAETCMYNYR